MSLRKLLEALGIPTVKENGCELGCRCASCLELHAKTEEEIRQRVARRAPPETLGEFLLEAQRERREKLH